MGYSSLDQCSRAHPGGLWQLLSVVSGTGGAAGADDVREDFTTGDAVAWSPGEKHSSGSDARMVAVIGHTSLPPRAPASQQETSAQRFDHVGRPFLGPELSAGQGLVRRRPRRSIWPPFPS
jgi:hypothetical protein